MTFDEFLRKNPKNGKTLLHRATGVSMPSLRKVERRQPIRLDVAAVLAEFLECDMRLFSEPKPRRRLARKAKA